MCGCGCVCVVGERGALNQVLHNVFPPTDFYWCNENVKVKEQINSRGNVFLHSHCTNTNYVLLEQMG